MGSRTTGSGLQDRERSEAYNAPRYLTASSMQAIPSCKSLLSVAAALLQSWNKKNNRTKYCTFVYCRCSLSPFVVSMQVDPAGGNGTCLAWRPYGGVLSPMRQCWTDKGSGSGKGGDKCP